jgi:hypothetical protein
MASEMISISIDLTRLPAGGCFLARLQVNKIVKNIYAAKRRPIMRQMPGGFSRRTQQRVDKSLSLAKTLVS